MRECCESENTRTFSAGILSVRMERVGEDILIRVFGGEKPHIGCVVMSIPRTSLTGDGTISCTSSVLSVTGHKDEAVCRMLAERAAVKYRAVAVCTGGIHVDNITPEQIEEVTEAIRDIAENI